MKKTFTFQTERGFLYDISTTEEKKKKKIEKNSESLNEEKFTQKIYKI